MDVKHIVTEYGRVNLRENPRGKGPRCCLALRT
jgi:hypothetical protein